MGETVVKVALQSLEVFVERLFVDVYVSRDNSKRTEECVAYKLREWGVLEKDFVFDLNGPGQDFKKSVS